MDDWDDLLLFVVNLCVDLWEMDLINNEFGFVVWVFDFLFFMVLMSVELFVNLDVIVYFDIDVDIDMDVDV